MEIVSGFSKLSKDQKINWISSQLADRDLSSLSEFWHEDSQVQSLIDQFSENTVSNFVLPFGLAPNFLINGDVFTVPMVIEESSVVAAASKAAKFWSTRGGFKAEVLGSEKIGNVHFYWKGEKKLLTDAFKTFKADLIQELTPYTHNMEKRGGGILQVELKDETFKLDNYFKLQFTFETCDAMGANFINTILEQSSSYLEQYMVKQGFAHLLEIKMSILSNYTPNCLVKCWVECDVEQLAEDGDTYASKFKDAIDIALADPYRAVTHNKGIFNGIDSVVLATGNDFRAIEACAHAYASSEGSYKSLSSVSIIDGRFKFEMTLPLALGTVGGLTNLHPLSKLALKILKKPNAKQLMEIISCVGLAQNFAAVNSLITTGIQKGHMKMHLLNICKQLGATPAQTKLVKDHFANKVVSYSAVREFLENTQYLQ